MNTVTCAVPAVAMSLAAMPAWSWKLLTKVVGRATPFQRTSEDATKLVPVTVNVKPAPPAVALLGESPPRVGTGFAGGSLMVKDRTLEVPPHLGPE